MTVNKAIPSRVPNPWWVGVVSGMASFIDSFSIVASGTALVMYQDVFGLTNTQYGVLSAALTLGIAVGALVGGRIGDQIGRKHVFSCTMGMIVIASILLVVPTDFGPLLVGMALLGLGTGADLPVSLATIAEEATDDNRGKILGLSNILWIVGIFSAQGGAAIVGGMGRNGGQILFGTIGVVAFIVLFLRLSIPESPAWIASHNEQRAGTETVRAQHTGIKDLLKAPYAKPFIALLFFYALTNVGANTNGQFNTWVNVNIIEMSVSLSGLLNMLVFPVNIIFYILFMRFVDTPKRMTFFYAGAACLVGSYLVYVIFGFSIATFIAFQIINNFGGAFAFEGIMKVWTQESFPTLLRTTAQGAIIFVARIVAAGFGIFTANIVAFSPRGAFAGLGLIVLIGVLFAIWGFKGEQRNMFQAEKQQVDPNEGN